MESNVERWLSMKEVCEYIGACHDTIRFWTENFNFPAVKLGRIWRFKKSDVDEWLKSEYAAKTKNGRKASREKFGEINTPKEYTKKTDPSDILADIKTTISYKPLFKILIDRNMKRKELATAANVSIATITKMRKDGAFVTSDVLERIATTLGCTIGQIAEVVPVYKYGKEKAVVEDKTSDLDKEACAEYGLDEQEQEIIEFIYEQLQFYKNNPPSFMINQVRKETGTLTHEEAVKAIPSDRFYSLVMNDVIEVYGKEGLFLNKKNISFKQIESGYFESK